ncbi:hypothetical protein [Paenibacillus polysaccharolyticus]|uniref:hypothetical protein n=1 Tax=Paenibacillus polysaccharolyticus TaxID=582692 RepID=UPI0030098ABE
MSNANKPVIPAEVADLIENMRTIGITHKEITRVAQGNTLVTAYYEVLSSIPFDTLLSALVNGYEREKEPEDPRHVELRKEYVWRNEGSSSYSSGMADGIRYAVAMLGVKIEGVNA